MKKKPMLAKQNVTLRVHRHLALALNSHQWACRLLAQGEDPTDSIRKMLRSLKYGWAILLERRDAKSSKVTCISRGALLKIDREVKELMALSEDYLAVRAKAQLAGEHINKKTLHKLFAKVIELVKQALDRTSEAAARVPIEWLLKPLTKKGAGVADISFDIFCPKQYKHHTRITFWIPRVNVSSDLVKEALAHGRQMLSSCGVREAENYVIGLDSRMDQYRERHVLMLDFDDIPYEEMPLERLKQEPGVLVRTESGYHFLGWRLYDKREWVKRLKSFKDVASHDHIELSLQRGYATLRLTASPRKPFAPIVCEKWSGIQ